MLPIKLGEMIRSGIHAQPTIRLFSFRLPIVCTTRQPETRSARWMNINIARRLSSLKTSEASFSEAKMSASEAKTQKIHIQIQWCGHGKAQEMELETGRYHRVEQP